MTTANLDDRKPVSEMADEFWGVFIRKQRLYLWSIGARTRKQGSDTDNGYEKEYETQSDETLGPLDAPETMYYRNRF